jgi:hypothetical protein
MISSRHCGVADFDADTNLQKPDPAVTLSMGVRPVDDRQRPGRINLSKPCGNWATRSAAA